MRAKLIRVWDETVATLPGVCRAEGCQKRIWWARTAANDKAICFDSVPVPVKTETDPETSKLVRFVDYDRVHWARCPGSAAFRRPR